MGSPIEEALARLRAGKSAGNAVATVPTVSQEDAVNSVLDSAPVAVKISNATVTGNAINVLEVQSKIAELSAALLEAHPMMPVLLRTIHTHLRKDPEIVTLLSEDEIGIIVNGLKVQTNTALVTTLAKSAKAPSEKAKLKALTADDL